eukprot:scaffold289_cov144-Skeletonema_menzelii.AAC.13
MPVLKIKIIPDTPNTYVRSTIQYNGDGYGRRRKLSRAVEGSGSAGLARCRNGHKTFEWEWWVWMMTTPHLQAEGEGCRVERNFGFGGIGGTCLVA